MSEASNVDGIPVFILCGGLGSPLQEETEFRPKPIVSVVDYPSPWRHRGLHGVETQCDDEQPSPSFFWFLSK